MSDIERRVHERAMRLWDQAGRPAGGSDLYRDRASELVAIEDNQMQATKPLVGEERAGPESEPIAASGPEGEPIEPSVAVESLGDMPGLTDQGEEQGVPRRRTESAGEGKRRD